MQQCSHSANREFEPATQQICCCGKPSVCEYNAHRPGNTKKRDGQTPLAAYQSMFNSNNSNTLKQELITDNSPAHTQTSRNAARFPNNRTSS
jgi:hypothetical protein